MKKKKQKFKRYPSYKKLRKLSSSWRKPRGKHSKLRRRYKSKGKKPSPGWGSPRRSRGLHPSGFRPQRVENPKQLAELDPANDAVMISSTVGKKKAIAITKSAQKRGLKVLNPKKKSTTPP